jgi:hypothetical protein
MSKSRLLNWNRQWLLSVWKLSESDDTRRFDQVWGRKPADSVEGKRASVNQVGRDLRQQVSSLILGVVGWP